MRDEPEAENEEADGCCDHDEGPPQDPGDRPGVELRGACQGSVEEIEEGPEQGTHKSTEHPHGADEEAEDRGRDPENDGADELQPLRRAGPVSRIRSFLLQPQLAGSQHGNEGERHHE